MSERISNISEHYAGELFKRKEMNVVVRGRNLVVKINKPGKSILYFEQQEGCLKEMGGATGINKPSDAFISLDGTVRDALVQKLREEKEREVRISPRTIRTGEVPRSQRVYKADSF